VSAFYEAALPAAAIFLLLAAAYRASRQPKNTRPVTESTQPVTRRATTHCAVEFCDAPVAAHVHAADEWWTFCLEHGLPYLTEGFKGNKEDVA
jgi:hypothetical protein